MSLARGKYGIEYNPRQMDDDSSGIGWIVAAVSLLVLVSLGWTLTSRIRSSLRERAEDAAEKAPTASQASLNAARDKAGDEEAANPEPVAPPVEAQATSARRPVRVRNLLMRLEEAEKARDVEMAVTTIETIRALPGSPAADLDDKLARRLGDLNRKRLFVLKNAQWVAKVTVRRGDTVARLAYEHGSTAASLLRLNGGRLDRLRSGQQVYVMNHPRFNLVLHRRLRTADLSLNGKFFRRYDLLSEVSADLGQYVLPASVRAFWKDLGIFLSEEDRAELEMLLPPRTPVQVSEM